MIKRLNPLDKNIINKSNKIKQKRQSISNNFKKNKLYHTEILKYYGIKNIVKLLKTSNKISYN